jgi:hypothetical protein
LPNKCWNLRRKLLPLRLIAAGRPLIVEPWQVQIQRTMPGRPNGQTCRRDSCTAPPASSRSSPLPKVVDHNLTEIQARYAVPKEHMGRKDAAPKIARPLINCPRESTCLSHRRRLIGAAPKFRQSSYSMPKHRLAHLGPKTGHLAAKFGSDWAVQRWSVWLGKPPLSLSKKPAR